MGSMTGRCSTSSRARTRRARPQSTGRSGLDAGGGFNARAALFKGLMATEGSAAQDVDESKVGRQGRGGNGASSGRMARWAGPSCAGMEPRIRHSSLS